MGGAVGRDPGCFNKAVVDAMLKANGDARPSIFALSNPKTQAEITSTDCWQWSDGKAIYGSGTGMESVTIQGKTFRPGQVNNVYIFPGVSMGAICCQARTIPERLFMVAAEAVANSLDAQDLSFESVVPSRDKIRTCGLNVAAAVVFEAQNLGIAGKSLGKTIAEVKERVREMMWAPDVAMPHATAGAVDDQAGEWDHQRRKLLQQESGVSEQSPAAKRPKLMQPIDEFAEDPMHMSDAAIGA